MSVNQNTLAEMLLDKSQTSEPFSVNGHWRVKSIGRWFGSIRIETRVNDYGRWHPDRTFRAMGDRNVDGEGSVSPAGSNCYFRLVFRKSRKKLIRGAELEVFGLQPMLYFSSAAVIDP